MQGESGVLRWDLPVADEGEIARAYQFHEILIMHNSDDWWITRFSAGFPVIDVEDFFTGIVH